MQTIKRSAILPYPREQMFHLVEDCTRYPDFVPGCVGAELLSHDVDGVRARLELSVLGRRYQVVTRNRWRRPEHIKLDLEEGPFRQLRGCWRFHALDTAACRVELALDCEPEGWLLGQLFGRLSERAADRAMAAMCAEAHRQYG